MSRTFDCAVCGMRFSTDTPEADINREFLNSGITSGAALLSACDACYDKASRGSGRG